MSEFDERFAALARFAHRIGRLKSTPRTGWLHRGIPPDQTESVADHSFRVAVLTWLASTDVEGLNRNRAIKLALLHDLAESITGDITPYDPASIATLDDAARHRALNQRQIVSADRKAAKQAAETAAIADLTGGLNAMQRQEIASLWAELQEKVTPESRFVKEIDILETYLQSREYSAGDASLPMESFAAEVGEAIDSDEMAALRDAISSLNLEARDEPA